MGKSITVRQAKEARQNLRKLTPANLKLDDDLEMTVKETVFFLAPDLVQMSKRGFTNQELSDGLAGQGIQIKPGTLNRYINDYLSAKEDAAKSEADSISDDSKKENPTPGLRTSGEKSDSPFKNDCRLSSIGTAK